MNLHAIRPGHRGNASRIVPLKGVSVYRGSATGWIEATTDSTGLDQTHGLHHHDDVVTARKDGYQPQEAQVAVRGDIRFDMQLFRK